MPSLCLRTHKYEHAEDTREARAGHALFVNTLHSVLAHSSNLVEPEATKYQRPQTPPLPQPLPLFRNMAMAAYVLVHLVALPSLSLAHPKYWLDKAADCTAHPDRAYGPHQGTLERDA